MKNRWGIGIAIFYGSFVLAMIGFVFYSRGLNFDLVREDYYQGDLDYQQQKDKISNAKNLSKDLVISFDNEAKNVIFEFPQNMTSLEGSIHFYRPNNKQMDFIIPIKKDNNNIQTVSVKGKEKGYWKVIVDWKGDGTAFYKKEEIFI